MGRDRISQLPECLINQILSHLPIEESVRTSVLSTRWKNLWLSLSVLDLKFTDFPPHGEVFETFLDHFLDFNRESILQKFKIDYEHDIANLSMAVERFVEWIATAIDRGIKHLDVETHNAMYAYDDMPINIYTSKTLVSLKLSKVCLVKPEFGVSLPCLKVMHLDNICYGDPLIIEKLISGCPVLEDLNVVRINSDFFKTLPLLRVRSQTLQIFRFTFGIVTFARGSTDFSVEIDAPGLKYMSFHDGESDRMVVKNLSSLVEVDLDTEFNVKGVGGSPLEPDNLVKRNVIRDFLIGISSVRHMVISQPTLEILFLYSKLGPIPKFNCLSHLQATFSSSSLQLLPIFLESCPNLKNLIVDVEPEQIELTNVPRCLTSTLEYIEINKLIMTEETEIKLVNYFLENSAVLKKLILRFIDSPMPDNASDSIMKLLTSTKLSRRCQVFVF